MKSKPKEWPFGAIFICVNYVMQTPHSIELRYVRIINC